MGGRRRLGQKGGEDSINIVVVSVGWGGDKSGCINKDAEGVRENVGGAAVERNHDGKGIEEG